MRRSIDDDQVPVPPLEEDEAADLAAINWAVSICDDYADEGLRVQLLVEEVATVREPTVAHLDPDRVRRLRLALASALVELGEDPGR